MAVTRAEVLPVGPPVPRRQQIGREGDLARLVADLKQGDHIVLADLRRTGKSTVALAALDLLAEDERNVIAAVDLSRSIVDGDSLDRALAEQAAVHRSRASRALVKAGGFVTRTWNSFTRSDVLDESEEALITAALEDLTARDGRRRGWPLDALAELAAERSGRAIVFVDEAQGLAGWQDSAEVAAELLARMRVPERPLTFLFAGSQPSLVEGLFSDGGLLEYDAIDFKLSAIDPQPWREGLRRAFRELGAEITDEAVDVILAASGGHPLLTMLAANRAHEQLSFIGQVTADAVIADEAVRVARNQRLWDIDT